MGKFIVVMIWLLVTSSAEAAGGDDSVLADARHDAWRQSTSVCYVRSFGGTSSGQGTGFMAWTYGSSSATIFFTAKHLVENQDSLRVTVVTYDRAGGLEPVSFTKPLVVGGRPIWFVPDPEKDVVGLLVTPLEFGPLSVTQGFKHYLIPRSLYVPESSLFEGLPVVICGFPLGLHSAEMRPVIRRGTIALVDSASSTIVLDAQVFPGSSGSAVFVDEGSRVGMAFKNSTGQSFIGLVNAYVPMRKRYINPADSIDQMLVSENAGLGLVVPSDVLIRFVDAVAAATQGNKGKQ